MSAQSSARASQRPASVLRIDALGCLDLLEGIGKAAGAWASAFDMTVGEDADHDEAAVLRLELPRPKVPKISLPKRGPVDLVDHRLADVAQGRRSRRAPCPAAAARSSGPCPVRRLCRFGGQGSPWRRHRPSRGSQGGATAFQQAPSWPTGPRHHRKARDGVHRVVDMRRAIARAHDVERNQVGAFSWKAPRRRASRAPGHVGGEDCRRLPPGEVISAVKKLAGRAGCAGSTAIERLPLFQAGPNRSSGRPW